MNRLVVGARAKAALFSRWLDKSNKPLHIAIAVTALAFLFFYPVIDAGVSYEDDTTRDIQTWNSHGYNGNGRFVAEAISHLLTGSFNTPPVNWGSFGQILGVVSLIAAVLILMKFRLGFSIKSLLFTLPLITNPFLLENISYKYDSFGMLLAYSLAIVAFAIFKQTPKRIILFGLLLFISAAAYQSMPIIAVILAIIWFVINKLSKNSSFSTINLVTVGVVYAVALIIQQLFVRLFLPPTVDHNAIVISPTSAVENIRTLITDVIMPYLQGGFIGELTFILVLLSIITYIILWYKSSKKVSSTIVSMLAIMLLPLCFLGPILILNDPNIAYPRVISSIVLLYLPCVAIIYVAKSLPILRTILVSTTLLLTLALTNYAFIYGSYLKNMDEYRNLQATTIYTAVQSGGIADSKFYLETSKNGYPIVAQKTRQQFPILNTVFADNVAWLERILANYNLNITRDWVGKYPLKKAAICNTDTQPIIDYSSFSIYPIPNEPEETYFIFVKSSDGTEKPFCDTVTTH